MAGSNPRVGGVVLCGGLSIRMGQPKAWLPFDNEPMLVRVVRLLSEAVQPILVVAAAGQQIPSLPHDVHIAHDEEEGRGPLQGLATGLGALAGSVDAVYLSSCDAPFLRPAFVTRLIALLGDCRICVPNVASRLHPLSAVYRCEVLPTVRRLLRENQLRLTTLLEEESTRFVEASALHDVDPRLQTLRNLNTPEEYEQALRDHAQRS